jgi:hypothetical protein
MCIVTAWSGEPRLRNAEHSALRWLALDQALALPLAHPSYSGLFQTALGRASVRNRDLSLRHTPAWHSARASCQQVMPSVMWLKKRVVMSLRRRPEMMQRAPSPPIQVFLTTNHYFRRRNMALIDLSSLWL